ncbi:MAG: hypothetical protein K2G37_00475, partial [Clostridia bacterium]|nr:hypothetical protein [Clostridia bacterium]
MHRTFLRAKIICIFIGIALILSIFLSAAIFAQSNHSAIAGKSYPTDNSGVISISELLSTSRADTATKVGDRSIFDCASMVKLYAALTGKTNATLDDVIAEMDKAAYNAGKTGDNSYIPNTSTNGYSNAFVGSIHYGMNAQDIRTVTGGSNIEVTLGGLVWNVVTLTTTGQAYDASTDTAADVSAGDVVLTLMLKDPIQNYKTYWNGFQSVDGGNFGEKYSSSYYSASLIRAALLNGLDSSGAAIKYATDANALTSFTIATGNSAAIPNYASTLGIFTNIAAAKNVTNFIVQPRDVLYQQDENIFDIRVVTGSTYNWGSGQNEASLNKLPSSIGTPSTSNITYTSVDRWRSGCNVHFQQEKSVYGTASGSGVTYTAGDQLYFDWGYDYLWLPSWAEVGENGTCSPTADVNSSIAGLWALNDAQRKYTNTSSSTAAWLRSGGHSTSSNAYMLNSLGVRTTSDIKADQYAVRPCLNLNLTAANKSMPIRVTPEDVEVEWANDTLNLAKAADLGAANWWDDDYLKGVSVEYWNGSVKELPKEPGTYNVKLSLTDTVNYRWADGSTGAKEIDFTIIPRYIPYPKWNSDGGTLEFNGQQGRTFGLEYDQDFWDKFKEIIGIDYTELFTKIVNVSYSSDITTASASWKYKAVKAGTYDLAFAIKNDVSKYYQWKDEPSSKKLSFTVSKKNISIDLTTAGTGTSAVFIGKEGGAIQAVLNVAPNQIFVDYPVKFVINAAKTGNVPDPLTDTITLTNGSGLVNIQLDLSEVTASASSYSLSAVSSSPEYNVVFTNSPTLRVEADNPNVIRWQLYIGGVAQMGYYIDSDINDPRNSNNQIEIDFDDSDLTIFYTGKYTEFKASAYPQGYALETGSYNGGYEVVKGTSTNNNVGVNADTYTTKVDVYKLDDLSILVTFIIKWKIAPALFDMSDVKWLNDGDLPYNGGQAVYATLDPTTLPKGLLVPTNGYSTNVGSVVGNSGTASVEFELAPEYEGNYILPVEGDKSTYTGFGENEDFEWEKTWQVVPHKISTSSWSTVAHPDSNKTF